jgi:hypothetical protein
VVTSQSSLFDPGDTATGDASEKKQVARKAQYDRIQRERAAAADELDRLFRQASDLKDHRFVSELIDWMATVRSYSIFNLWLARTQRPGCGAIATRNRWEELGRKIKSTAEPIIILRPMGPVMLVYEVADTDGPPLPPSALSVGGAVSNADLRRLIKKASKDGIAVNFLPMGINKGGDARSGKIDKLPTDFLIRLNDNHKLEVQFATLCHELAHIYCGHCGRPSVDSWWLDRRGLGRSEKEFEAEGAAHLVLARGGLTSRSAEYLSGYAIDCDMRRISVDTIIRAANRIEDHYEA